MRHYEIKSAADALSYITDCNLATVSTLAGLKSRSNYEFTRQKNIAQTGVKWILAFDVQLEGRVLDVVRQHQGSVEAWAEQYDVKAKK